MRDPNRLYDFYRQLQEIHITYFPDWRFGQLMCNFISECGDPFYWEEDEFLRRFKEYVENLKK